MSASYRLPDCAGLIYYIGTGVALYKIQTALAVSVPIHTTFAYG